MGITRTVTAVAVIVAGTLCTGANASAQRGSDENLPRIWTGVYTSDQAEQGKVPFTGLCRRCHSDDLEGSERGPALKGEAFMSNWDQQDLDRLRQQQLNR